MCLPGACLLVPGSLRGPPFEVWTVYRLVSEWLVGADNGMGRSGAHPLAQIGWWGFRPLEPPPADTSPPPCPPLIRLPLTPPRAGGNPFQQLLDRVLGFLQTASPEDTRVWIDVLAVNQHQGTEEQKEDVSGDTFDATIAACSRGTIVVMDGGNVAPASRAWCTFEW